MKTCVKCGYGFKDNEVIYFDHPTGNPSRYICKECAEEEGMLDEEDEENENISLDK